MLEVAFEDYAESLCGRWRSVISDATAAAFISAQNFSGEARLVEHLMASENCPDATTGDSGTIRATSSAWERGGKGRLDKANGLREGYRRGK